MLWRRSLVMRDVETESLWSHLLGEAMAGRLKGKTLDILPSSMTDWKTWKSRHPDTTVVTMSRTARGFTNEIYRSPEAYVLGYVDGGKARAWPFSELKRARIVNDEWNGRPLLVVYDPPSGTALLYDRRVGSRTYQFRWHDGKLLDAETASSWDWATGKATTGTLKAKSLRPLAGVVSFRRAWKEFHPDSSYWRRAGGDNDPGPE